MAAELKQEAIQSVYQKPKDTPEISWGFVSMQDPFMFGGYIELPDEDEFDWIFESIDSMNIEPCENYPNNPTNRDLCAFLKFLSEEMEEAMGGTHQEYIRYWIAYTLREYSVDFQEFINEEVHHGID